MQLFAQNNLITAINITLPANPDANTANWGTGTSLFMISATAQMAAGRINPVIEESRMLVIIKKGGNKICGAYNNKTAPAADFNTMTKVWSGSNLASFLGKNCILAPGDYEVSVQFFGEGPAGTIPVSDEKTKPFTIKGNDQQAYQMPQPISPANNTIFTVIDIKKPIIFRWSPVIPKPQEPVTYRLSVWQLMQGQTGTQAIKVNQPIITKDYDNITQAVINNIVDGPCKPPLMCDFVWNIQALRRDGKSMGGNNGLSETFGFSYGAASCGSIVTDSSVKCKGIDPRTGLPVYAITITLKNIPTGGVTGCNATCNNLSIWNGGGTISNPSILPVTVVPNGMSTISFNYSPVSSGTASATFLLNGNWNDALGNTANTLVNIALPPCDVCSCGKWGKLNIQTATRPALYDCGSTIEWNCNQPLIFSASYTCNGTNDKKCQAVSSWEVTKNGSVIVTGNGGSTVTASFTPTANGTYTISLNAVCNGIKCPVCTYTVMVTNCVICSCGTWGSLNVPNSNGLVSEYKCGSNMDIRLSCNQPFSFSSSYQCSSNNKKCQADISWEITEGTTVIKTGTGTGSITGNFTPVENGTYTLTLSATCGGVKCPSCVYKAVVTNCCSCGSPVPVEVNGKKYQCGSTLPWTINHPFTFTHTYLCSPDNKICSPRSFWEIQKDGVSIKSGSGSGMISDGFTPATNGNYSLTINTECNGKRCTPCIIYIRVPADSCPALCNGDFEIIDNGLAPSTFIQTNQANIPCWKTMASDQEIEIWHTGFGNVNAYSGIYFAEINATMVGALYQTFTINSPKNITVSFAHRGRYPAPDVMKVSIIRPDLSVILLGTYSDNQLSWIYRTTAAQVLTVPGIYTLKFESVSSDGGKGPANGGNFLDDVSITCTEGGRNR